MVRHERRSGKTALRTALYAGLALAVLIAAAALWLYTPDKRRADLEATYFAGKADYLEIRGLRLHIRDQGPKDAPALILIHGFGSSLLTWDAWADRLQTTNRVIRFDLPGFGLTGPDPTGDYSDGRAGDIIVGLMDQLGLQRATIIGNSLGGRVAWRFAVDHPDRVDKLVLISPDGFASPGFEYGKKPSVPLVMQLLPFVMPRALLKASLTPAYGDPARLTPARTDTYYDMMLAPGVRSAIIARMRQETRQDPTGRLHQIEAPTLILWGEKDGMIPFSNAADYARAIPHASVVALPGLGHVPFEEAPDASLAPVQAFLAQPSNQLSQ